MREDVEEYTPTSESSRISRSDERGGSRAACGAASGCVTYSATLERTISSSRDDQTYHLQLRLFHWLLLIFMSFDDTTFHFGNISWLF